MDKYIRFGDAINAIKELPDSPNGFSDTYDKAQIIAELEEVPAADVRPVVYCKDCKYGLAIQDEPRKVVTICQKHRYGSPRRVEETDFCAWGEKYI